MSDRIGRGSAPRLVALGDPMVDVIIPVQPQVCRRLGLRPGTAVFRDRAELDATAEELGGGSISAGGSVANTCVSFADRGGHATLLAALGTDAMSGMVVTALSERGVALPIPRRPDLAVGRCLVLLLPGGERSFVIWQGDHRRRAALLAGAAEHLASVHPGAGVLIEGYLLVDDDGAAVAHAAAAAARARESTVVLALSDPRVVREHRQRVTALLAAGVELVLGNEAEFAAMSDARRASAEDVAAGLARRGITAVVTLGGRGAVLHTPTGRLATGPPPAPARGVTSALGAGDAFAGGFLAGYLAGVALTACIDAGLASAGRVLDVVEARPHGLAEPDPYRSGPLRKISAIDTRSPRIDHTTCSLSEG